MNKLAIIPIFFLTMCGTAPVIDPPAHACSPRLDGEPTYCPDPNDKVSVVIYYIMRYDHFFPNE